MTKREELRALIERLESDHYKEGGPWTPWVSIAEVLPFLRDYADALEAQAQTDAEVITRLVGALGNTQQILEVSAEKLARPFGSTSEQIRLTHILRDGVAQDLNVQQRDIAAALAAGRKRIAGEGE